MNLWRRFSGQRSCKILYVMTPWSKEINDFTESHLQVHPSLYLAFTISYSLLAALLLSYSVLDSGYLSLTHLEEIENLFHLKY